MDDARDWERELGRVVERVRTLSTEYDLAYDAGALENSVCAADDQATWPLAIGQHAQYCLIQAIDMCEGIADLVTNEQGLQIPLAATYPLARAAIESASMAIWMMAPGTRRERVVRRLQAAHDELVFEKAFIDAAASSGESVSKQQAMKRANGKDAKHLKRRMREIARVNDIEPQEYVDKMPGWSQIVESAAPALHGEGRSNLLVAAWRFASGLTHPSFVRGRIAHSFAQTKPGSDASHGEITGSITWIVSTAFVAEALTRRAIFQYRLSKSILNVDRPVPTPRR